MGRLPLGDAMTPALPDEMPLYIFASLDLELTRRLAAGERVLDLTKSDPTLSPPEGALSALRERALDQVAHHYPPFAGTSELRRAVCRLYAERFGVHLDPDRNVYILGGSKEGLVHLASALIRPGDAVLVPDPGFPAYAAGARLAGARRVDLPLLPHEAYLPDVARAIRRSGGRVRLAYLNYPNNPTGAMATPAFFAAVADLAREEGFWVCHDFAYVDICRLGLEAPSFLAAPGALSIGVETITWSKSYAMQGFRLAALVGSAEAIAAFAHVESNVMAGVPLFVQAAGLAALAAGAEGSYLERQRAVYGSRLGRLAAPFEDAGWPPLVPPGAVYLWPEAPDRMDGRTFARLLLDEAGVAVSPGGAFGRLGEQHVRISATATDEVIEEAAAAIARLLRTERLRPPPGRGRRSHALSAS
jgi:aspartate/methionine/tyrosine aminotransferase